MSGARVTLRPVVDRSFRYVERLLERNGLPTADVRTGPAEFYVATRDGDRVGVGGLEHHGDHALVRSLVVDRSARGQGVGTAICAALEDTARDRDVGTCYLLTTTAADFFAARGYREIERADVPPAIRETAQFGDHCPSSAVCMRKPL